MSHDTMIEDVNGEKVNIAKLNKQAGLREGQWNWMGYDDASASYVREMGGLWIKPDDVEEVYYVLETTEYPENPGEYLFEFYKIDYGDLGEWELSELMDNNDNVWPDDVSDVVVEEAMNGGQIPDSDIVTNYWGELQSEYGISPPKSPQHGVVPDA
jgi:hypothetical protein